MKTFLNDRQSKNINYQKEVGMLKKIKIASHISEYKSYLSSSLPKESKTIKKYINEKLNSIKKTKTQLPNSLIHRNSKRSTQKTKTSLIYNKNNATTKLNTNLKTIDKGLNQKIVKKIIYKKNILALKNTHRQNDNIHNDTNIHNDNYKSFNAKKNDNSKIINSISTSGGMTNSTDKDKDKNEVNSKFNYYDDQKTNFVYSLGQNSLEKNNILINRYNNNRFLLEESNYCKHKINNFNYETGSDDNLNENIVFLKCDNYSSLTFGNSFSYSNSQRSKKYNDENLNINNINNINDNNNSNNIPFFYNKKKSNKNYVNKLKEENEALKKELKESNDQISLLKYQIKELAEINCSNLKKSTRNIVFPPPNLWDKRHIKYDFIDSNSNNNINNSMKMNKTNNDCSMSFRYNERMKIKKDMLARINNTFNEESFFKNKKKLINVKKNINLKKKCYKKNHEEFYSLCQLDKPCEKITECISNLRI